MSRNWLFGVLTILAMLAVLYWLALPPVWIERTADGVKVHVERLGEYNSTLSEFVIQDDATREIVVRLLPRGKDMITMWTLQLRDGPNEVAPNSSTKDPGYVVDIPQQMHPAFLARGLRYNVSVRGFSIFGTDLLPIRLRNTAAFVL